jgi:hypothetical protein
MTVKTVIIPDIHNDYLTAEKIIKNENPDKTIFLGDYFDDFDDTIQDAINTAKWLVQSLKQENRIHLIGNHDLSYMTDNPNLKCAGYRTDKHKAIKECDINWNKLKMYYFIDGKWLCTHAGFSNDFFKQLQTKKSDSVQKILDFSKKNLDKIDDENHNHPFFQVGFSRGGSNDVELMELTILMYKNAVKNNTAYKRYLEMVSSISHWLLKECKSEHILIPKGYKLSKMIEKEGFVLKYPKPTDLLQEEDPTDDVTKP